jgi:hypothetical protein
MAQFGQKMYTNPCSTAQAVAFGRQAVAPAAHDGHLGVHVLLARMKKPRQTPSQDDKNFAQTT